MNKQEKIKVVSELHEDLQQNEASFIINFRGLTVQQLQTLRKQLRQNDGSLKIAKARLMKRAAEGIEGIDPFKNYFKDQVGLVFAKQNFPALAKTLHDFAKQNQAFSIVAGFLESRVFDKNAVTQIAQLPPKEVLAAQLCGVLKAPVNNMVGILNMLTLRLIFVLKKAAENQENQAQQS